MEVSLLVHNTTNHTYTPGHDASSGMAAAQAKVMSAACGGQWGVGGGGKHDPYGVAVPEGYHKRGPRAPQPL